MFTVILLCGHILLQEHLTKFYQKSGQRRNIVDAIVTEGAPTRTSLTSFSSLQRNALVQLSHQTSSLANEPHISLIQSFPSSGSPHTAELSRCRPCKTGTCLADFAPFCRACGQPLSLNRAARSHPLPASSMCAEMLEITVHFLQWLKKL